MEREKERNVGYFEKNQLKYTRLRLICFLVSFSSIRCRKRTSSQISWKFLANYF